MCNQLTVLLGVLLLRFLVQGSSLVAVLPVLPTIWTLVVVIFWAELAAALAMSTLAAMPTIATEPKLCVTQWWRYSNTNSGV